MFHFLTHVFHGRQPLSSIAETNSRLLKEIERLKSIEQELLALKSRYEALINGTRVIVWTTDAEGKFITPQVSWECYTGQSWEEHQGFGWLAALHEEDQVNIERLWGMAVAAKSVYRANGRLWHAASQTYHKFVVEAVPVIDEFGEIEEWFGTISDVHELKTRGIKHPRPTVSR